MTTARFHLLFATAIATVFIVLTFLPIHILSVHANGGVETNAAFISAQSETVVITPAVVAVIYGASAIYSEAYNGEPYSVSELVIISPTSTITLAEASQCDTESLPPPVFEIRRTFIEYNTAGITRSVVGARLVFTNSQPFIHNGTGAAVHDLHIHTGTWTSTAQITPTFVVASSTFQSWHPSPLASIDFGTATFPYPVSPTIDPAVISDTVRLVFRTSSESLIGPKAGSCPTDPPGIGNKFTLPLLELEVETTADKKIYLPIVIKNR